MRLSGNGGIAFNRSMRRKLMCSCIRETSTYALVLWDVVVELAEMTCDKKQEGDERSSRALTLC